ncbi:little elongation complex subunit 2-like [Vespa mandarinia]|uniref:little elongation complex subunit 2-like n=1 Tax=Vespa mandarinia TaxID=7446 RepID=UPI00161B4DFC|nr:little elongation complex subunit 2-like [Vespa mandarinia]
METFLNIDWNPSLNDILDDVFINEERLTRESVMYRLLHGNFVNPFDNMDEDYEAVKMDVISEDQNSQEKNKNNATVNDILQQELKEKKVYVPGLVRRPCKFPKTSELNIEEQQACLRTLLTFSASEKPNLTVNDKKDLAVYFNFKEIINEEQEQYIEFVKGKWDGTKLQTIYCEDYINLRWKHKLLDILKLPRYYMETTNIPFVSDKEITVQFIHNCLKKGSLPKIILPSLTRPFILQCNSKRLQEEFPIPNESNNTSIIHFKLPVSKDPTCEFFAQANDVDLVISSSGLNCLASNAGPNYSKTWALPITIKSFNGKNIIYIDKPPPSNFATVPEKNTWVFKYILKSSFQSKLIKSERSCNVKVYDDDLFGNINSENYMILEDDYESKLNISNNTKVKTNFKCENIVEEDKSRENESHNVNTYDLEQPMSDSQEQSEKEDCEGNNDAESCYTSNVSYNLFRIGPSSTEKNELMKNTIKEYKMLVRIKEDGYEELTPTLRQKLLLIPKLEHQVGFGGEALTLEEGLKQWISLMFRPDTYLARVRISAQTSEVIQIEKRTTISINNEIKRLYNIKVEDTLTLLHNVIQTLSNVTPGCYIIRHISRNGAFATVYKETDARGKNILDLHTIYGYIQYNTIPNTPWPALDKLLVTPMHKHFKRMPLMFYPQKENNKRKFKQKTKNKPK